MENQLSEEQLKEIALQLSKPTGEEGIKTAQRMNITNLGMTKSAIEALLLAENDVVLEIGPGNAQHLPLIIEKSAQIQYFGVDVSATMINEAKTLNATVVKQHSAHFYLINGQELPFPTLRFDKVFTVNTIYFWQNPSAYLAEIKRVMKPGGIFSIAFADRDFMAQLPFTPYGFKLYNVQEVIELSANAGFTNIRYEEKTEQVPTNANILVTRPYFVIRAEA